MNPDEFSYWSSIAVGSGMLSAAIIKLVKQLSVLRWRYHEWRFRGWLTNRWYLLIKKSPNPRLFSGQWAPPDDATESVRGSMTAYVQSVFPTIPDEDAKAAREYVDARFDEVMNLSGNDIPALFGQRAESLVQHLRMVAHVVISFPKNSENRELAYLFTGVPVDDQVEAIQTARDTPDKVDERLAEIQRRTSVLLDANLNAIEVSFLHWWDLMVKAVAALVTLCVVLAIVPPGHFWLAMGTGLVGGFLLAPVTNDLVKAVSKLRGRG